MSCDDTTTVSAQDMEHLKENITTIDTVVESDASTTTTPDGKSIYTLSGRLAQLGFEPPVAYAGGISFDAEDRLKTVERNGIIYAPLTDELPFTTSGTWTGDDADKFYTIVNNVNRTVYETGTQAAANSHPDVAGYTIECLFRDSNQVLESGHTAKYTGTTTLAKAGNWFGDEADGYGYDADGKQFELTGYWTLAAYGIVPGTDAASQIQAAIDKAEADGGRDLILPPLEILVETTLTIDSPAVGLIGFGSKVDDGVSDIVGGMTVGPVLRVSAKHVKLHNFTVSANATRRAATRLTGANYAAEGVTRDEQNYGIWIEGPDTAGGSVEHFDIQNVWVHNQPSDSWMIVGKTYNSRLEMCGANNGIGHGLVIDNGLYTDRSNVAQAGVISIPDFSPRGCTGHGTIVGNDSDTTAPPLRVVMTNLDSYNNGTDTSIMRTNGTVEYETWFYADNSVISDSGIDGNSETLGGVYVAGRNTRLINNRYLETKQPIRVATDAGSVSRASDSIYIDGILTTNATLTHTFAAIIDSGALAVTVIARAIDGNFTDVADDEKALVVQKKGELQFTGLLGAGTPTELTISSGAVTITGSYHTIDTEGDAATDDLDTINGGKEGDILIFRPEASARDVTFKNATGNIFCGSDRTFTNLADRIVLQNRAGTAWDMISFADN